MKSTETGKAVPGNADRTLTKGFQLAPEVSDHRNLLPTHILNKPITLQQHSYFLLAHHKLSRTASRWPADQGTHTAGE